MPFFFIFFLNNFLKPPFLGTSENRRLDLLICADPSWLLVFKNGLKNHSSLINDWVIYVWRWCKTVTEEKEKGRRGQAQVWGSDGNYWKNIFVDAKTWHFFNGKPPYLKRMRDLRFYVIIHLKSYSTGVCKVMGGVKIDMDMSTKNKMFPHDGFLASPHQSLLCFVWVPIIAYIRKGGINIKKKSFILMDIDFFGGGAFKKLSKTNIYPYICFWHLWAQSDWAGTENVIGWLVGIVVMV